MTLAQLTSSPIARPPRLFRPRRKKSARYSRAKNTTEAKSSPNDGVNDDDGEKMRKNPDLYRSGGDDWTTTTWCATNKGKGR